MVDPRQAPVTVEPEMTAAGVDSEMQFDVAWHGLKELEEADPRVIPCGQHAWAVLQEFWAHRRRAETHRIVDAG